jgi:hypothetical protein
MLLSVDELDLSCCVLGDEDWLFQVLRSSQWKKISLRGCVFDPDSVASHSSFVSQLGSIGLSNALGWIDLRGLRPEESALLAFVASLRQKRIHVVIGIVSKSVGMNLLNRASNNVMLGFGEAVVFVPGRRADFAAVASLIKDGKDSEIAGIRTDIDDSADPKQKTSEKRSERPKKPWESKQSDMKRE